MPWFSLENCFRKALDVSQSRALHSPMGNCFRKALQVKFKTPLSHASRASHTSHFAICLARSPMPRPAECKARSSVEWVCVLRVVEHLPLLCDSVVKDQLWLCHCYPEGLGRIGGIAFLRVADNHMPPGLRGGENHTPLINSRQKRHFDKISSSPNTVDAHFTPYLSG